MKPLNALVPAEVDKVAMITGINPNRYKSGSRKMQSERRAPGKSTERSKPCLRRTREVEIPISENSMM